MNVKDNWTELYSPWDTLIDCMMVEEGHPNASELLCSASNALGSLLAYVFPVIGTLDFINNSIVVVAFLYSLRRNNRQFFFFGILALSDIGIVITTGWLWLFPTFGLPYASSGSVYYLVMARSTVSCKLSTFSQSFCYILRGNVLLMMTIDRFILIYKPLLYKRLPEYSTRML
ncbi:unnamed protein product [Heterobilharzia americana]|nr:unnamed protein product [Heterobilharzia americana]